MHVAALLVFVCAPSLLGWTVARADTGSCLSGYENAQRARRAKTYRSALDEVARCAEEECPAALRNECRQWRGEIEAEAPTVVFLAATENGKPLPDVTVSEGAFRLASRCDGRSLVVDPGVHTFRFERRSEPASESHGDLIVDVTAVVVEAEHAQKVSVVFRTKVPSAPSSPLRVSSAPDLGDGVRHAAHPPSSIPWVVYPLAGLGVVGLGTFAGVGIWGLSDESELRGCRPTCSHAAVDSLRIKYIVSDVGLVIGVAGVLAATIVYLARPRAHVRADLARVGAGL